MTAEKESDAAIGMKAYRERMRGLGLRPREAWCHDDDWPTLKRCIDRLLKKRGVEVQRRAARLPKQPKKK